MVEPLGYDHVHLFERLDASLMRFVPILSAITWSSGATTFSASVTAFMPASVRTTILPDGDVGWAGIRSVLVRQNVHHALDRLRVRPMFRAIDAAGSGTGE